MGLLCTGRSLLFLHVSVVGWGQELLEGNLKTCWYCRYYNSTPHLEQETITARSRTLAQQQKIFPAPATPFDRTPAAPG